MDATEKQKAYHKRKMRTRLVRLDKNKDGVLSLEDFELIGQRMATIGNLSDEQAKKIRDGFTAITSCMKLDKGVKFTADQLTETQLSMSPEEVDRALQQGLAPMFEVLDANSDGHISMQEFKVYLKALAPDLSDEEVEHAFNTIDTNKNKVISRDEFTTAVKDFFFGVEETEVSRVFLGKLTD